MVEWFYSGLGPLGDLDPQYSAQTVKNLYITGQSKSDPGRSEPAHLMKTVFKRLWTRVGGRVTRLPKYLNSQEKSF